MRLKPQVKRNRRLKAPFKTRATGFFKRAGKFMAIAVALPLLAFGAWKAYRTALTTPYLAVRSIEVRGSQRVTKEDVIDLSGIKEGQNILALSAGKAVEGVRRNPWVESASVKRGLPGTVTIEVREREPLALVKLDEMYLMDVSGSIFKKFAVEDEVDLPVVTGLTLDAVQARNGAGEAGLLELIAVLRGRRGFDYSRVSEIRVDRDFGLSVYTMDEGVRLDVGRGDFEDKLRSFERILRSMNNELKGVEAMDLNNSREVIVRFTTNVAAEGGEAHGQKG